MMHSFVLFLLLAIGIPGSGRPSVAAMSGTQSAQPGRAVQDVDTCLSCHSDRGMSVTLPDGETRSLYIDRAAFERSVHGGKLGCVDCHSDMTEVPHPARPFKTSREFTVAYTEQCKRCHFANYSKTLDSVHFAAQARGDVAAPLCVDCHGSHDITPPDKPRTRISLTCARCHAGVQATYAKSVHGRALFEESNADVPVCTDCHHSHDVGGPREPGWRLKSPEICANCHTNERLMKKYGISTDVMSTYLADFHGMTASLQSSENINSGVVTALCIDCHGVHDITKITSKASPAMKANLVKVCQRCHPGATENFSSAWMSHYEPTFKRAPLVYSVKVFYSILIPFMIGGLLLQILLHLWRVVVNR
jgi:nitrate/TMAO reductase-like tetraheme cytochrome c subunit